MNSTKLFTAAIISLTLTFQVQSVPTRSFITAAVGAALIAGTGLYLNESNKLEAETFKIADIRAMGEFMGVSPDNGPWGPTTLKEYQTWARLYLTNSCHCQDMSLKDWGCKIELTKNLIAGLSNQLRYLSPARQAIFNATYASLLTPWDYDQFHLVHEAKDLMQRLMQEQTDESSQQIASRDDCQDDAEQSLITFRDMHDAIIDAEDARIKREYAAADKYFENQDRSLLTLEESDDIYRKWTNNYRATMSEDDKIIRNRYAELLKNTRLNLKFSLNSKQQKLLPS